MLDTVAMLPIGGHFLLVDVEDIDQIMEHNWSPNGDYVQTSTAPERGLHRLVMKAQKGEIVDHINGKTWDCRKVNLRKVTRSQNAMNARAHRKAVSKYRGVSRAVRPNRTYWQAQIMVSGHQQHLGYFQSEEAAARAYDEAAARLHGPYARRNFT